METLLAVELGSNLGIPSRHRHPNFASIGQPVNSFTLVSKPKRLQLQPWHETLRRSSVDKRRSLPKPLRVREIPDRQHRAARETT